MTAVVGVFITLLLYPSHCPSLFSSFPPSFFTFLHPFFHSELSQVYSRFSAHFSVEASFFSKSFFSLFNSLTAIAMAGTLSGSAQNDRIDQEGDFPRVDHDLRGLIIRSEYSVSFINCKHLVYLISHC